MNCTMTQVNNNAESLSRELRKLKNLKSIDFRGLLSGNSESYVNLYRQLFCDHNVAFSRFIVDKGFELSGLNDYKFMESVYRMMRDLFNLKPPINQNQFFSSGFTQRKLEMTTMIVCQVRKSISELTASRACKKTVQTQSLMKTSLKRPNSAPKQTRIIEFGDNFDEDQLTDDQDDEHEELVNRHNSHKISNHRSKKISKSAKTNNRILDEPAQIIVSSDSERSNPANSLNNFNQKTTANMDSNNKSSLVNGHGDYHHHYHHDYHHQPPPPPPPVMFDATNVSAYEPSPLESKIHTRSYDTRPDRFDRNRSYDVKQYTPRSTDIDEREIGRPMGLERMMHQFEEVLGRIGALENRMQRIEMKLDNNYKMSSDYQLPPYTFYSGQNYQQYSTVPNTYHETGSKLGSFRDKRDSKNVISDFESHYPSYYNKNESSRLYNDVNSQASIRGENNKSYLYGPNVLGPKKNEIDMQYQSYGNNLTSSIKSSTYGGINESGSHRSQISTDVSNSNVPKYVGSVTNYTDKRSLDMNNSSRENSYRASSTNGKSSQPAHKTLNGIPPVHPSTKKSDDSGFDDHRHGKSNVDKNDSCIQSQTDRIASLLSDTQKMLRISDEEL